MAEMTEARVRERAHQLWEQAGEPDGQSDYFWHRAEQELRDDEAGYDTALEDSFPASDPPGNSGITGPEAEPPTTANEAVADPGGVRPAASRTPAKGDAKRFVSSGDRNDFGASPP